MMEIQTYIQPADYAPVFEKITGKADAPRADIQSDPSDEKVSSDNSKKLSELTTVLEENNISLTFSRDEETKAIIVKLVDKVTGEEIRQIPSEVSLKLVAVNAKLQGNFLDEKS